LDSKIVAVTVDHHALFGRERAVGQLPRNAVCGHVNVAHLYPSCPAGVVDAAEPEVVFARSVYEPVERVARYSTGRPTH
jgi:hypothetical protein